MPFNINSVKDIVNMYIKKNSLNLFISHALCKVRYWADEKHDLKKSI